jgi:hypothetical protein
MSRTAAVALGLALLPTIAPAATMFYTENAGGIVGSLSRAAFDLEVGARSRAVEGFSGRANEVIQTVASGGTTFGTGINVAVDTLTSSNDNIVELDTLKLSLDSTQWSGLGASSDKRRVETVTVTLPRATTFLALDFGRLGGGGGVGNDSGTSIVVNGVRFNLDPDNLPATDVAYAGFFGVTSDTAFTTWTLVSNNTTGDNDDDFNVRNLAFQAAPPPPAPIPLPAGAWLLLGGLGVLGAATARRRG